MMEKVLFFIPARGNSKGLPGKNIRALGGKPLIVWTIEAALNCGIKGRVIVSTDSQEIASIAEKHGAEIPGLRPAHLALDETPTMDAVYDFLHTQENLGYVPDHIIILQPTSPLRTAQHIKEAYELFENTKSLSVVSVCQMDHHPFWANTLPEDLSMDHFLRPEVMGKRRQDFPEQYRVNGAIYIASVAALKKDMKIIYGKGGKAYIMDKKSSVDIDTEEDFLFAQMLVSTR